MRYRLACPSGFGNLFSDRLLRFHREFPEIALELLSGSRRLDLKKGEAELALRVGPITDDDLIARKVAEVGWSLYASDAYLLRRPAPIDPCQLAGHEVLGYDASLAGTPGAQWIDRRHCARREAARDFRPSPASPRRIFRWMRAMPSRRISSPRAKVASRCDGLK